MRPLTRDKGLMSAGQPLFSSARFISFGRSFFPRRNGPSIWGCFIRVDLFFPSNSNGSESTRNSFDSIEGVFFFRWRWTKSTSVTENFGKKFDSRNCEVDPLKKLF